MDDLPREKLCRLIDQYGPSLCDDPRRCEGLLRDLCGEYKREINLLISATKEQVPAHLLSSKGSIPWELLLSRLSRRLQDNLCLTKEGAFWAVESWALALGVTGADEITQPQPAAVAQTGATAQPSFKETPPEPQPVKTRFTKAKDGVISDSATDLEWYVGPDQDTNWNQAKSWTESLTVAGGGWRMPTIPELKDLFQKGADPNNMGPIFQTTGYWVWSGQMKDALSAWTFYFTYGQVHPNPLGRAYNFRAFAVRSRR